MCVVCCSVLIVVVCGCSMVFVVRWLFMLLCVVCGLWCVMGCWLQLVVCDVCYVMVGWLMFVVC